MKKVILTSLLILIGVAAQLQTNPDNCNVKSLENQLSSHLGSYKYDSSHITRFSLNGKKQEKSVVIPLFEGEKYKLLFNTSAMPKGVQIKVYNESATSKKKDLLFNSSKDNKTGNSISSFTVTNGNVILVEYSIKSDAVTTGCIAFMVGYEI